MHDAMAHHPRAISQIRWLQTACAIIALAASCGDDGSSQSGLRAPDPERLMKLEACFPSCFARVLAQKGCAPEGACMGQSGKICFANGVRHEISSANGVIETKVFGSDDKLCYTSQLHEGLASVLDPAGVRLVEVAIKSDGREWSVSCDGTSQTVDLETPACKAANAIPGAEGGCAVGVCE